MLKHLSRFKFRAWDEKRKEMIRTGFFIKADDYGCYEDRNPEDLIIMQSTGLTDKNGKDIFESDIVRYVFHDKDHSELDDAGLAEVCWNDFEPSFQIVSDHHNENFWDDKELWTIEVLGNIYENPELSKLLKENNQN